MRTGQTVRTANYQGTAAPLICQHSERQELGQCVLGMLADMPASWWSIAEHGCHDGWPAEGDPGIGP